MGGRRTQGITARLGIGLVDSGVSSLGNLGVSIIAARSTDLVDFGLFSTAFIVLLLVTAAFRSAHGDPLVLKTRQPNPAREDLDRRNSTASVLRLSVLLGAGLVLVGLLLALLPPEGYGTWAALLVVAGTGLPLLCLQDHLRWIEYARGGSHRALVNNLIWTVTSIAALLAVRAVAGDELPAWLCLLVWAYGTVPAIGFALVRGRLGAGMSVRARWLRPNRSMITPLFLDFSLTQAAAQGATLVIAAMAGPIAMAYIRKGQIWMGPLTVATIGLLAALQPILAQRAAERGESSAVRLAVVMGSVATLATAVYGVLVMVLPTPVAQAVVGTGWAEARDFIPPLTVAGAAGLLGGCLGLALRITGLLNRQVRWRSVLAPASVALAALATAVVGPLAGAWAIAGIAVLTALVWGLLLTAGARQRSARVAIQH
jgi:O-antigen/teichoic acid export membrane protein